LKRKVGLEEIYAQQNREKLFFLSSLVFSLMVTVYKKKKLTMAKELWLKV